MHSRYPRDGHVGCFRKRFNSPFPWSVRPSPIFQFASFLINKTKTAELAVRSWFKVYSNGTQRGDTIPSVAGAPRQTNKKTRQKCIAYWCSDDILLRLKGNFTLMDFIIIRRTMRDWNVSVWTCRIIGYQQIVNSTFTKMSWGWRI